MATEEAIAAGLIDWVNSLAVANPVYTVEDLSNGHVIWKVLRMRSQTRSYLVSLSTDILCRAD